MSEKEKITAWELLYTEECSYQ